MASTTIEDNKQFVRHSVEQINEKNSGVFDELFAEDGIDHTPFGETRGPDGPREGLQMLHTAFPDLEMTLDDLVAEGDIVAMRSTHRGTHEGPFMGIEPTGTEIEAKWMVFVRIEDGTVVERWTQGDLLGLMQQLGAVDLPTP